jgi:hypothetical protein
VANSAPTREPSYMTGATQLLPQSKVIGKGDVQMNHEELHCVSGLEYIDILAREDPLARNL